MEKIKLEIHEKKRNGSYGTLGMPFLINSLRDSDLFEVGYHNETFKTARDFRSILLLCNGKKVCVDFWEYPAPTYTSGAYNYGFDLIVKIQDRNIPIKKVHRYLNRKKMLPKSIEELTEYKSKIVPWTFFPSRIFEKYVGKEDELIKDQVEVDKLGFFCGKAWKCRNKIMSKLSEQGIETWKSDQGNRRGGRKLKDDEFINYMRRSKYGIVLAGRASMVTDQKNRREVDYMMMKKPLLLNYKPYYYNEFVEGKHYIYIDDNTDLKTLEDRYNIEEIAKNGHQWYLDNVRPKQAAEVFRKILKDKLNV